MGEEIPPSSGSVAGRPLSHHGRKRCWQIRLPAGPAGGDCPISPSPWAQGWPWALPGVPPPPAAPRMGNPPSSRAPSTTVASLCWTPHSCKPTPETSEKRQLPLAPHCLWMLSLPVGWALRVPDGTHWPRLHSSPPCPHCGPGCTGLPDPECPPPGKCPCKVCVLQSLITGPPARPPAGQREG